MRNTYVLEPWNLILTWLLTHCSVSHFLHFTIRMINSVAFEGLSSSEILQTCNSHQFSPLEL